MEILIPIVRHSGVNMKTGRSIKDNDRLELANDTEFVAAVAAGFCLYAAMLVHAVSGVKTQNAGLARTS